jgi:crossover junction endodeoxyribonuclease RuvC
MIPVIGVDLSLTATGMATAAGTSLIASTGHKGATLRVRHARLTDIATTVTLTVSEAAGGAPALVVIEGPAYASTSGAQHDRSGLWWLTLDELLTAGHLVAEVPPTTLKRYATGRGIADKGAMVDAAARRLPNIFTGGDNNRVDALFLRAMGCDRLGTPLTMLPETHRKALDAVVWPDIDLIEAAS